MILCSETIKKCSQGKIYVRTLSRFYGTSNKTEVFIWKIFNTGDDALNKLTYFVVNANIIKI